MYEVDTNEQVRELCRQIVEEQDPDRVEELIATLRHTIQMSQDETRLRMRYVARHFRGQLREVPFPAGEPVTEAASRVRAVLDFLGLGRGMRLGQETEG
jgi:hypothetical protein